MRDVFSFLRTTLRRASLKWPARKEAMEAACRKYEGPNKRQKWEYLCAHCHGWFKSTEVEVDHVIAVGELSDWDDVEGFVRRLFCESERLQVLCVACHKGKRSL